ncbi:hypothetical protein ACFL6N_03855 [Thermodesulfobacteriota bacterium]
MDYTTANIIEFKLIEFTVNGLLSEEIRKEILMNAAGALSVAGYNRLLIDLVDTEFKANEPVTGALTLVTYMRKIGFPPMTRMAFIYSDAESHRKYFENVAQADGFHLKYFKNRDEAIEWLCE